MVKLTTESPLSRRIVLSFLDFLRSVEPTPGTDLEGLEVVRECLEDVFKLNSSSDGNNSEPGLLVKYFSSMGENEQHEPISSNTATLLNAPSTSSVPVTEELGDTIWLLQVPWLVTEDFNVTLAADERTGATTHDFAGEPHTSGVSRDELFGQFIAALENIRFFSTTTAVVLDHPQLDRVTHLFHEAVKELEEAGCQTITSLNLAETFKSQGNTAMRLESYTDALELYTFAIALCQNNSVYYCNRAAAFTQMQMYIEAIMDCEKSIEIDPNYSKAYSRLGLAYYGLGNYRDAIDKGFMKALQLDPDNDSVKENIRVAEQKLRDVEGTEQQQNQRSTNGNNHESTNGHAREQRNFTMPSFTSTSFNPADLPPNIAEMFMNMNPRSTNGSDHESTNGQARAPRNDSVPPFTSTSSNSTDVHSDVLNMYMNMVGQFQEGTDDGSDTGRIFGEPGVRIQGGNISMNIEDLPEEFLGTWRSVMGMFAGAQPPHQNPQGDTHRGPTPN